MSHTHVQVNSRFIPRTWHHGKLEMLFSTVVLSAHTISGFFLDERFFFKKKGCVHGNTISLNNNPHGKL